jgi:hypothetical protein
LAPDIIVGGISDVGNYGTESGAGISAFSIGTTSCNLGTCDAIWEGGGSNQHPVIAQNMYRLKDSRFEHIGQSWLKHGFATLSGNLCSNDCNSAGSQALGVNCSDP